MKRIIPLLFFIALFCWSFSDKPAVSKGYNSYVLLPASDSNTAFVRGSGGEIIIGHRKEPWQPDSAAIAHMFKKLPKQMIEYWGDDDGRQKPLPAGDYDWQLIGYKLKDRKFIFLNGVAKSLDAPQTVPAWKTTAYETNHLDGGNLYCFVDYSVTDGEVGHFGINAKGEQ